VVEAVGRALGKPVPHAMGARRAGDPPSLVADPEKAKALLGWAAQRSSLEQLVEDALRWEMNPAYGSGLRGADKRAARTPAE
jgi:UDP-glucose 4-epimerase